MVKDVVMRSAVDHRYYVQPMVSNRAQALSSYCSTILQHSNDIDMHESIYILEHK